MRKISNSAPTLPQRLLLLGRGGADEGGGTTAPVWSPGALPGLQLWFDTAVLAGLANGDPVPTWPDLSGGHRDAVQATTAARPTYVSVGINGRPVLRFDGADDTMVIGNVSAQFPSAALLVIVASMGNANGQQDAYSTGAATSGIWSYAGSSYDTCFSFARHQNYRVPTPAGVHCYVVASDSGAWRMSVDGSWGPTLAGTFDGGPNHRLGVSPGYEGQPLLGDLGEVIAVSSSSLTTTDQARLAGYLLAKWGVTL